MPNQSSDSKWAVYLVLKSKGKLLICYLGMGKGCIIEMVREQMVEHIVVS